MQGAQAELKKHNQELEAENKALRVQVESLKRELEKSHSKLQHALNQLFRKKSETFDPRQLELLLSGIQTPKPEEMQRPALQPNPVSRPRPKRVRKLRIPENLLTEDIVIEPDEVKVHPQAYQYIGEEITQELDVIPPQYIRRRFIRRRYVFKANRTLAPIIAELPPRLILGGYASVGLVTDIIVKKYLEHLPLYRQEQTLRTCHGIDLSRKTMCDWIEHAAWWLRPVYDHIGAELRQGKYLQIDETPVRFCRAEGGGSKKGFLWVYNKPWGGVLFEWHTGRGADCLEEMLKDFGGTAQTDGYGAYQSFAKKRLQQIADGATKAPIVLAACWAHARRKFHEALEESPRLAGWMLRQIQHLYQVEAELREREAGPSQREAVRASQSRMILRRLEKALRAKQGVYRPSSDIADAIDYTLSLWKELQVYVDDGQIEIDNNLVENAIRPTAIGKKNYLFFGDPEAGERSAILYTLLENCKREGINPHDYLRDVLARRLITPLERIAELTPANWAAARREKVA
jgi:transposase